MASPQLEDGFTRMANELLDAFARMRLPGQEGQIVWAILRKTYGYGKKTDEISYGQLTDLTGIDRRKIIALAQSLVSKKVLGSAYNGTRKPLTFWINKNYEEWVHSAKKDTSAHIDTTPSAQNGDSSSAQKGTHKRKKDIHKENYIPLEILEFSKKFHEHRQKAYPNRVKQVTNKQINDGALAVMSLVKKGYSLESIRAALKWGVEDHDFWSDQLLSLCGLTRPGKNGLMKFINLMSSFEKTSNLKLVKINNPNSNLPDLTQRFK